MSNDMKRPRRLLWIDIETTGLDPDVDQILEIAISEATVEDPFNARPIYHATAWFPEALWPALDPIVREMHTANGLLAECARADGPTSWGEIAMALRETIPDVAHDERPIVAGASVHFDVGFIERSLASSAAKQLSHQHFDVTSIKLFAQALGMPKLPKAGAHRARADIDEAIAHGRQIRAWLDDRRVVVQTAVRASGVSAAVARARRDRSEARMTIHARILAVLERFDVMPDQGPVTPMASTDTLIDALEQAAVEPLIDAIADTDCCCACCERWRDVLTVLAGGTVP